jgi:hypothetical protein
MKMVIQEILTLMPPRVASKKMTVRNSQRLNSGQKKLNNPKYYNTVTKEIGKYNFVRSQQGLKIALVAMLGKSGEPSNCLISLLLGLVKKVVN